MYAIIRDRGRQYTVRAGDKLDIDLLPASEDAEMQFEDVLLVSDGTGVKIGQPTVSGACVTARRLANQVLGKKIEVMKFRRRNGGSQTKTGHRQRYTRIEIASIDMGGES
jgi:large subunit ribosomal protein L21